MNDIAKIYDTNPEYEWDRLFKSAYNNLEFTVFLQHIMDHLPPKGFILDAGAGPGRYSIELCKRGYDVTLLDISTGCIENAQKHLSEESLETQQRLKEFVQGSVTDLKHFEDDTFDAVLCFDPLSCLPEKNDREKAISELIRVAKPNSIVAISVRGYLAALRTILRVANDKLANDEIKKIKKNGNIITSGLPHHFFRIDEVRLLAEKHGLKTLLQAAGEGLSDQLPQATEAISNDPEKWKTWLELVIEYSTDSSVVDMSSHMLYIGRKT